MELGVGDGVGDGVDDGVGVGATLKVAVTLLLVFITIVAGFAEPESAPLQPANVEPPEAFAVNVTEVFAA